MGTEVVCPITGSEDVEMLVEYDQCITSDCRLLPAPVANCISRASGLIFNASGARGSEDSFYADDYDLHSESAISEFKIYGNDGSWGIHDRILKFITEGCRLPDQGSVLDIGCGKGLLLKAFSELHPKWDLAAVEPSLNAHRYFEKVMPELDLFNGTFEASSHRDSKFELILSNGVLEHVPDPLEFLKLFRSCLTKDGRGYIGVPNFLNNPVDLFTYDHLSRFTPDTIEALFATAGFHVLAKSAPSDRVAMWYLVTPSKVDQPGCKDLFESSRLVAKASMDYIDNSFSAFQNCITDATRDGGTVGLYGTGAIGLLASQQLRIDPKCITAFFDDNETVWGSQRIGRPVEDPGRIESCGITHMFISANPCYRALIERNIRSRVGTAIRIYG